MTSSSFDLTANSGGSVRSTEVASLRPWPDNPRRITSGRLVDLQRALESDPEMLWARPLIALPDGTVICGNQRLLAAQELGWPTIPTLTVELNPERARLWALRDNAAYGEWDEPALSELLAELAADGIDLALTGFASSDLDRLLADFQPERDPDDAPDAPTCPRSKPGELYELGPHRLLCADARDRNALRQLVGSDQVDVLWTDPPYGVSYTGKTKNARTIRNDTTSGLDALLADAWAAVDTVLAPGARFYIAAPAGPQGTTFRTSLAQVGWQLHQVLVWVKDSMVLGHSDYHYRHEDILYGWKPGTGRIGRGRHDGSCWYGDNAQTTVFDVPRPVRSAEHPTMKPVALIETMLRNSSRRGDIVLDPFAGSGSTLIACDRLDRRCLAVEVDAGYCDVIRERYEAQRNG